MSLIMEKCGIAKCLDVMAVLTWILGFVVSIVNAIVPSTNYWGDVTYEFSFRIFLTCLLIAFIAGIMFLALSKIIHLLDQIRYNTKK